MRIKIAIILVAVAMVAARPAMAQNTDAKEWKVQNIRPLDQRGINIFEDPNNETDKYTGFALDWGAAFQQALQSLKHSNNAAASVAPLTKFGTGFAQATANMYLHAQLAKGIRVQLAIYLSARRHQETWVKDGYLLIDALPLGLFPNLMKYVTIKAGHMEIDFGDSHFRRSDGGNGIHNPFVGNYIVNVFTTEIGAQAYLRNDKGFIGMLGLTGGEIKGNGLVPEDRSPAILGKAGVDRQVNENLRVRLTGSFYYVGKSPGNTIYGGDRAGSRYFYVTENTTDMVAVASSGEINPGFRYKVTAFEINPFVKAGGLELFGSIDLASGRTKTETANRKFHQYAVDVIYRFMPGEVAYVAGRYNTAGGRASASHTVDISARKYALAGGIYLTPSLLVKGEYVNQEYFDYPKTDKFAGAKFSGVVVEGVIAF